MMPCSELGKRDSSTRAAEVNAENQLEITVYRLLPPWKTFSSIVLGLVKGLLLRHIKRDFHLRHGSTLGENYMVTASANRIS